MNDISTVGLYVKKILKKRLMYFTCYEGEDQYDPLLGKYFGFYENNDNGTDRLFFYEKGISWKQARENIIIFYKDIRSHQLEDGKSSLALLLGLDDGSTIRLPVQGKKGKFLDSLNMLCFFSEVVGRVYKINVLVADNAIHLD